MKLKQAFFIIMLAMGLTLLGMIAVILVGNARGYHPSVLVLIRNMMLIGGLIWLFFFLKRMGYRGSYRILVIITLLSAIGHMVQYRLKADLDTGGVKAREERIQHILRNSLRTEDESLYSPPEKKQEDQGTIKPITRFLRSLPGWWKIFLYTFVGIFGVVFILRKYGRLDRLRDLRDKRIYLWLFFTIILMAVFIGLSYVGTRGRFLYDMTPWEFFKVTLIVILAGYLSNENVSDKLCELQVGWKKIHFPSSPFIIGVPLFVILLIPQFMFILLGDFGQVILYGGLTIIMIFVATRRWIYLMGGISATIIFTKLLLMFGGNLLPGRRFERFLIWSDLWNSGHFPNIDAWWRAAYQMVQGLFSMKAGGLFGTGLGLGYPTSTPLVVQDFVYTAVVEEMGFIGGLVVVLLFIILVFEGFRIASESRDEFTKLLAAGFSAMLGIQAFVNIGGVTNLIPMTGLTLPFISRGGFSLIVSYIMVGFLMTISHVNAVESKEVNVLR